MTEDQRKLVERIRERANQATSGPWVGQFGLGGAVPDRISIDIDNGMGATKQVFRIADAQIRYADFNFVACARADIPALLAIIDQLDEQEPKK